MMKADRNSNCALHCDRPSMESTLHALRARSICISCCFYPPLSVAKDKRAFLPRI